MHFLRQVVAVSCCLANHLWWLHFIANETCPWVDCEKSTVQPIPVEKQGTKREKQRHVRATGSEYRSKLTGIPAGSGILRSYIDVYRVRGLCGGSWRLKSTTSTLRVVAIFPALRVLGDTSIRPFIKDQFSDSYGTSSKRYQIHYFSLFGMVWKLYTTVYRAFFFFKGRMEKKGVPVVTSIK